MNTPQVSATAPLGIDGTLFGNSGVDATLYAQLLLVKDYDDQLKDSAHQIKVSNKLKEAYRRQKQAVEDLYGKDKDKDGKVTLTQEELSLLESQPNYHWDKSKNDGQGGVIATYKNNPLQTQSAIYQSVEYTSKDTPIAANQTTRVWGDPHVVDADGGQWDFQGVAGETYQYLKDANLQVNATHKIWGGGVTVIGEAQVLIQTKAGPVNILANPNGFTLNGQNLAAGMQKIGEDGYVSVGGHRLTVVTPEYSTVVDQVSGQYLDLTIHTKAGGVSRDGILPDGVAGQTFDADAVSNRQSESELRDKYRVEGFSQADNKEVKVDKEKIEGEMERIQMEIDSLNGNGELMSLTLQTLTNQRKTAFETVSNIFSKSAEAANNIARNIGR